jgi:soluble lytic murein transglycosylase-like protein
MATNCYDCAVNTVIEYDDRYDSLIRYYASQNGFYNDDWLRFKAQIKAESNFNPDAVSPVGARGLTQFMPLTWKEWYDGTPGLQEIVGMLRLIDPRDPEDAIFAQVKYMKWLLGRFSEPSESERWEKAFAAYNWGIGNVRKLDDVKHWKLQLPLETKNYLVRIEGFYHGYKYRGA